MAVSISVRIDIREAQRQLERLQLDHGAGLAAVNRALDRMAFLVQEDAAANQIIRGGKGPPHPTRLTSRTGTLRRSIRVNRSGLERAIGTDLVYGIVHELGGRYHPRRAYLAPALEAVAPRFEEILAGEIQRLIDG